MILLNESDKDSWSDQCSVVHKISLLLVVANHATDTDSGSKLYG